MNSDDHATWHVVVTVGWPGDVASRRCTWRRGVVRGVHWGGHVPWVV